MKKIIITVGIILVLALMLGSVVTYIINSPEYALAMIVKDVKNGGFDALEKHLTDDANKKIEPIRKIKNNFVIGAIISLLDKDDYASVLIDKAKEVNWSVGDVIKNNQRASVAIKFDYPDKFSGSVDLELIKTDGKWKINDLNNLEIDDFSLLG